MSPREETEEGVHPSETPLRGQHGSQTEAPRRSEDFWTRWLSNRSDKSRDAVINFKESCSPRGSEDFRGPRLSNRSDKSKDAVIDFKESCSPRVPLESQRSKDLIENVKKSHPSTKKKLPHRVRDFLCRSFRRKSKHVKESLQTI